MKLLLTVTVLEIVYVIYMLKFFKTHYSLAHPLVKFNSEYLKHPIGKFSEKQSMICQLGHDGSKLIGLLLLIRFITIYNLKFNVKRVASANKFVLFIIGILSFMNFNALVYLIPFFVCEIFLIKNLYYY